MYYAFPTKTKKKVIYFVFESSHRQVKYKHNAEFPDVSTYKTAFETKAQILQEEYAQNKRVAMAVFEKNGKRRISPVWHAQSAL